MQEKHVNKFSRKKTYPIFRVNKWSVIIQSHSSYDIISVNKSRIGKYDLHRRGPYSPHRLYGGTDEFSGRLLVMSSIVSCVCGLELQPAIHTQVSGCFFFFYTSQWGDLGSRRRPATGAHSQTSWPHHLHPAFTRWNGPMETLLVIRVSPSFALLCSVSEIYKNKQPSPIWMAQHSIRKAVLLYMSARD